MSDFHQVAIEVEHDIHTMCDCIAALISNYASPYGHGPVCANLDRIEAAYMGLKALRNRINSASTTPQLHKEDKV